MLNIYDAISNNHQLFKQFKVDDLHFVEYNCIIEETKKGFWSHKNAFFYVVQGKKKWISMYREYIIDTGDLLFVKKGAYIAQQFFDEDFCALIIFLPDDFIRKVIIEHQLHGQETKGEKTDNIIQLKPDDILSLYFNSLLNYFSQPKMPPKSLLKLKFEELIINIISGNANNKLADYFIDLCSVNKTSLSDIMEANFAYSLKLEEYARLCGRSLSSFKRDFIEIYKMSPGKWLTEKRLTYGKYLLETTDKDINEIAFECGYEDASHFIKIFKDKYGKPPLQYKNS